MKITLTTNHPQSSYGIPMVVIDNIAYGPDDIINNIPIAAYIIINIAGDTKYNDMALRFFQTNPYANKRAQDAITRLANAPLET